MAVVLTQDCDAIHGDCAVEPALEVVFLRGAPVNVHDAGTPQHMQLRAHQLLIGHTVRLIG
ncbi:MAG: hypothetical protein ACYC3Q_01235, partial [Gemmatimonadaceae bacterium]